LEKKQNDLDNEKNIQVVVEKNSKSPEQAKKSEKPAQSINFFLSIY